jgi:hypothetical protein
MSPTNSRTPNVRSSSSYYSVFRLSLSHHVDHFDAIQDRASALHGLKPHHQANPPLDGPMILFDTIIQVGTLADADRLELSS